MSRLLQTKPTHRGLALAFAGMAALVLGAETLMVLATHTVLISSKEYMNDFWFVLDSMWRTHLGQRPNVDFQSSIGPSFYAVYRAVEALTPFALDMMLRADLLVGLVAAALTALILHRRAPLEAVALLALLAFSVAVSGREYGAGIIERSYSFLAPYNRWGWSLMVPSVAGLMLPRTRASYLPGVLLGCIGGFLLFLKISYFAVFVCLALASLLLNGTGRRAFVAATMPLLVPIGLVALLSIVNLQGVAAYVHDVQAAASINPLRIGKAAQCMPEAVLFLALSLFVLFIGGKWGSRPDWRDIARVVLTIGAGGAILLQNHDTADVPLYLAALVIAYALCCRPAVDAMAGSVSEPKGWATTPAFVLTLLLCSPVLFGNLFSPVFQLIGWRTGQTYQFDGFRGTPAADFRLKDLNISLARVDDTPVVGALEEQQFACFWPACENVKHVEDGLLALRQVAPNPAGVLSLDFSNPFPALMQVQAPRKVVSWFDYGRSFTEQTGPTPTSLYRESEVVMEPRFNGPHDHVVAIYGPGLPRYYRLVRETPYWRIWLRKPEARATLAPIAP